MQSYIKKNTLHSSKRRSILTLIVMWDISHSINEHVLRYLKTDGAYLIGIETGGNYSIYLYLYDWDVILSRAVICTPALQTFFKKIGDGYTAADSNFLCRWIFSSSHYHPAISRKLFYDESLLFSVYYWCCKTKSKIQHLESNTAKGD